MRILTVVAMVLGVAALAQAAPKAAKGQTKEAYCKAIKKKMEKKGAKFDAAKVEAKFAKLDVNKDGIMTKAERKAGAKPKKK